MMGDEQERTEELMDVMVGMTCAEPLNEPGPDKCETCGCTDNIYYRGRYCSDCWKYIKVIVEYRRKGWVRPKRFPGDKKGPCMRCGANTYDFYSRYKHCSTCGLDSFFESVIRHVKWAVNHGGVIYTETEWLRKTAKYIENLVPLKDLRARW